MLSKYQFAAQSLPLTLGEKVANVDVLTNFFEDYRLSYALENESRVRTPMHLQGVDTFIIRSRILRQQSFTRGPLEYNQFLIVLDYFHRVCPSSFFQDDYILSFLFDVANVTIHSIWDYDNFAQHVEGVSKSNFQMHMNPKVFQREEETKQCITERANAAVNLLRTSSSSAPQEEL